MTRVGVEAGLRTFSDALRAAGFEVVELNGPVKDRVHAVVVSGVDSNLMGIADSLDAPVVTARGRTPEEVVDEVRRSLGPRE